VLSLWRTEGGCRIYAGVTAFRFAGWALGWELCGGPAGEVGVTVWFSGVGGEDCVIALGRRGGVKERWGRGGLGRCELWAGLWFCGRGLGMIW